MTDVSRDAMHPARADHTARSAGAASHARRLGRGFAALVVATSGLIVLGALVRANGAGLACPDWPLCFGEVVPRFDLRVAFEWGHRAVAGTIAIGFATLAAWTLRDAATRRAVGPLLGLAAVLLGLQILLGALTVWHLLASWSVTSHLLVGNAFNAVLLLVSLRLLRGGRAADGPRPRAARAAVTLASVLLALQMLLGGLLASTYAGLVCPDWPTCRDGVWFPHFQGAMGVHLTHRLNAYALLVTLALAAWQARRTPGLRALAVGALALGTAQLAVGVTNVLWRLPVEITGLHSALAAGLVLTLTATLREAWRRPTAA